VNVEHFGFLSWFFWKSESHEQDGETLSRARFARNETASGDPAMALRSSIRLASGSLCPKHSAALFNERAVTQWRAKGPPTNAREKLRARKILNGECQASR
jgi:hypothetical protein